MYIYVYTNDVCILYSVYSIRHSDVSSPSKNEFIDVSPPVIYVTMLVRHLVPVNY